MKCPHCSDSIHFEPSGSFAYEYDEPRGDNRQFTGFDIEHGSCPACGQLIVLLREGVFHEDTGDLPYHPYLENPQVIEIIFPKYSNRPVEAEVPEKYKLDFQEGAAVLQLSPKASAAISRRLLQDILRNRFKIKPGNLADEIDEFLKMKDVPSYLATAIDAVRNIGNFAAHPIKDTNTGEVVDVENGEAEWLLEVLEALFDFAFVQPKRLQQRRSDLNEKLKAMGKPPMKGS